MTLYPDPGEPFPDLDGNRVWLFHGTTPEIAAAIARDGWVSSDPNGFIAVAAGASGVNPERLADSYAVERFQRNLASCTTGWRQAASYARRGPEFKYYIQRGVGLATVGEPTYVQSPGAILLLAVPWKIIEALDDTVRRETFLPDASEWTDTIEFALIRAPDEILLPPDVLNVSILGIDLVADTCTCTSNITIGREQIRDPRVRCSLCYLGSLS